MHEMEKNPNRAKTIQKDFDLVLVDPGCGIIRSSDLSSVLKEGESKDQFLEKLEKSSEYLSLMAQVKFFNGNISNYSAKELEALKSWIDANGAKEVELFLLQKVLCMRPEDQRRYFASGLKRMIDSFENRNES